MTNKSTIAKRNKQRRSRYKSVKAGLKQNYKDSKASLQAFTSRRSPSVVDPLAMKKKKLAQHLKRMLEGSK